MSLLSCVCDAGLIKYKSFTQITRTLDLIYFLYDFGRKFIAKLLKVVIQVYLRVFLFIFMIFIALKKDFVLFFKT